MTGLELPAVLKFAAHWLLPAAPVLLVFAIFLAFIVHRARRARKIKSQSSKEGEFSALENQEKAIKRALMPKTSPALKAAPPGVSKALE